MPVSAPPKPPLSGLRKLAVTVGLVLLFWGALILAGKTFTAIFAHNEPNLLGEWLVFTAMVTVVTVALLKGTRR